jgi:hypothetical protein
MFYAAASSCAVPDAPAEGLPGSLPTFTVHGKRLDSGVGESLYGPPAFRFTDTELNAIPYALWCNRTPGEMIVWLNALL